MSDRELNRIEVLSQVVQRRMTITTAANVLVLSRRQTQRLLKRFRSHGPACTLLVFIDDATSTLMQLRFVKSESTFSYFEALKLYLRTHGRPVAFYSDKHTVFRVANQAAKSGHGMTQFGRAMNELNIEILCANSSQARGRVERANRTLQDRLVKALRLAKISDIEAANAFLPEFMERFNSKFAKIPLRSDQFAPSA